MKKLIILFVLFILLGAAIYFGWGSGGEAAAPVKNTGHITLAHNNLAS